MTIARLLNQTAIEHRTRAVYQDTLLFKPYVAVKFSEFGPARSDILVLKSELCLGAAVPTVTNVAEIESEAEVDCIKLLESTDKSEEEVECNELGDEVVTGARTVEQIFDQNLYWRSSLKVAGIVQFSGVADGSAQDVHFQQSFQQAQLRPPENLEGAKKTPSAFQDKTPLKEEKPMTKPVKGKVHWLTAKKGKFIQSQQ